MREASQAEYDIVALKDYYLQLNKFQKLFFPSALSNELLKNPLNPFVICKVFDTKVGFFRKLFLREFKTFSNSDVFTFYLRWKHYIFAHNEDVEGEFNWITSFNNFNLVDFCLGLLRSFKLLIGREKSIKNREALNKWIDKSSLENVYDQLRHLSGMQLVSEDRAQATFESIIMMNNLQLDQAELVRYGYTIAESKWGEPFLKFLKGCSEAEIVVDKKILQKLFHLSLDAWEGFRNELETKKILGEMGVGLDIDPSVYQDQSFAIYKNIEGFMAMNQLGLLQGENGFSNAVTLQESPHKGKLHAILKEFSDQPLNIDQNILNILFTRDEEELQQLLAQVKPMGEESIPADKFASSSFFKQPQILQEPNDRLMGSYII